MYNGITRAIETELVPCLRKYNIRLVCYNPLAGGLLTGKITSSDQTLEKGSRFDSNNESSSAMATMYRKRYLQDDYFEAIKALKPLIEEKHGLRMTEVALRWIQHHSCLKEKDGVILGASSAEQVSFLNR